MPTEPTWLKNFTLDDFRCHCEDCKNAPDRPHTRVEIIRAVQDLRDFLGKPLRVTRGVSCPAHNQAVGGGDDSRHLPDHADAVDLAYDGAREAYVIVEWAIDETPGDLKTVFTAFEVCTDHIHLDGRPGPRLFLACK